MALEARLKHPTEATLTTVALVFSIAVWVVMICAVMIYGPFIALGILITHGLFLANLKGNAVRISATQYPGLYQMLSDATDKLALGKMPEAYVVQAGGALNAFALRFLSRNYVVIFSDLVDHCQNEKQLAFVVGHEVGHLAAGHTTWNMLLLPARVMPWLGTALRRSQEYTCDRCGYAVTGDLEQSKRALAVLSAGGKLAQQTDLTAFAQQRAESGGFFMSAYEIGSEYPFLCNRVAALDNMEHPNTHPPIARNPFGVFFGPFFGGAGAAGSLLPMVAVIGILAAIAIPNFMKFQQRAKELAAAQAAAQAPAPTPDDADPFGAATPAAAERDLLIVHVPVAHADNNPAERAKVEDMASTLDDKLNDVGVLTDLMCEGSQCTLTFAGPDGEAMAKGLGPTLKGWKMLKHGSVVVEYADGRPERVEKY